MARTHISAVYKRRALQLRREAQMLSPAMGAAMIGTMYFVRANCAQHGGSASGGGLISASPLSYMALDKRCCSVGPLFRAVPVFSPFFWRVLEKTTIHMSDQWFILKVGIKRGRKCGVAVISAKNHKRQRRKRQSVTAKREKSQTPEVLTAILTLPNLTKLNLTS